MDYLARTWDGSRGEKGEGLGYWGCMAIACENGGRRVVPLQFRVWSAKDPCYASENAEVEKVVVFSGSRQGSGASNLRTRRIGVCVRPQGRPRSTSRIIAEKRDGGG